MAGDLGAGQPRLADEEQIQFLRSLSPLSLAPTSPSLQAADSEEPTNFFRVVLTGGAAFQRRGAGRIDGTVGTHE